MKRVIQKSKYCYVILFILFSAYSCNNKNNSYTIKPDSSRYIELSEINKHQINWAEDNTIRYTGTKSDSIFNCFINKNIKPEYATDFRVIGIITLNEKIYYVSGIHDFYKMKLLNQLDDNSKDWASNILLYQFYDITVTDRYILSDSSVWKQNGKSKDIEFFHTY